ncbi:hypothetical protein QYE76_008689 [Lolium multiflorum]|uniref:Uncharacterized protein n=1 Tax=Lolium multiflorum TaxID=4521 RepID=A0AAD8TTS0_LOLMU|nr:hypothetical protein QYE76_008689 [Lolium multiflorum]
MDAEQPAGHRRLAQRPAEEQPGAGPGAVAGWSGSRLALGPSRPGYGHQCCSWAGFYKPYPTGVCTDRLEAGESCTGRNRVGVEVLPPSEGLEPGYVAVSLVPIPASGYRPIPEASIEALRTQLAALQDEKEQLIRQHREALDAQETYSKGLKDQLIQLGLKHNEAMKATQAAAEAKLNEALEDANNSTVVLWAELEEGAKARKAAEDQAAAWRESMSMTFRSCKPTARFRLFLDSQAYAMKKVAERRVAQAYQNMDAPWDPYDHLVALNARVSCALWTGTSPTSPRWPSSLQGTLPEEEVPANLSLTNDRLKVPEDPRVAMLTPMPATSCALAPVPGLDLDALIGVRDNARTDLDPVLTVKRQDRAYRIAEYAAMRTFIPLLLTSKTIRATRGR